MTIKHCMLCKLFRRYYMATYRVQLKTLWFLCGTCIQENFEAHDLRVTPMFEAGGLW